MEQDSTGTDLLLIYFQEIDLEGVFLWFIFPEINSVGG